MSTSPAEPNFRPLAIVLNRLVLRLSRYWLLPVGVLVIVYVGVPWMAPLFMELGWDEAGRVVYLLYTFLCHQLPQRSFFLFGDQPMYSLGEIQTAWQVTNNPTILRQFIGDPAMGWKVAWSDRMVFMYTTVLLWAGLFWLQRRSLKPLRWWGLVALLLPMTVDGLTHMISDLTSGIGLGFRDSNAWLVALTNNAFPATFYVGDGLGSFNSWMRLISGLLFSLGFVWAVFPRLNRGFASTASQIEEKLHQSGLEV